MWRIATGPALRYEQQIRTLASLRDGIVHRSDDISRTSAMDACLDAAAFVKVHAGDLLPPGLSVSAVWPSILLAGSSAHESESAAKWSRFQPGAPGKEVLLGYSLSGGRADDVEGKLAHTSVGNRPAEGPKLPKVLIVRAEQAARVIDWVPSTKTGGARGSEAWLASRLPPWPSDR
jgi:hypothetical protein